ncbi:MAG: glycosyltransferase family 2 protein [Pirellulaceae bacterium]
MRVEVRPQVDPLAATTEFTQQRLVWVLLPVYNEGQAIVNLTNRIRDVLGESEIPFHVVIVDDGSSDGVLDDVYANHPPERLTLLRNRNNLGLGGTMKRGVEHILNLASDNDVLVTMDGDDTHPPESIPEMLDRIDEGTDVVIASRFQDGAKVEGLNSNREWLSRLGRFMFIGIAPIKGVKDYTCGFRAFRIANLKTASKKWGKRFMTEKGFTVTADLLLKLRYQHPKCCEVPLHLSYQNKTSPSKMKVVRTTVQTIGLLFRHRLGL